MKQLFAKLDYILEPGKGIQIIGILLLMLIGGVIETLGIGIIMPFVSLLNNPTQLSKSNQNLNFLCKFIPENTSTQLLLILICMGLILIYSFKNVFLSLIIFWQHKFIYKNQINLSNRLFKAYIYAPYTFHLQRNTADIVSNIISEVGQVFSGVLMPALTLLTELIVVTFIFLLLVYIEPFSSILALVILSTSMISFNLLIRRKTNQLGLIRQRHFSKIVKTVNQSIGGIKETKVLGRENLFLQNFSYNLSKSSHADMFASFTRQTPSLFIETIILISVILIVLLTIVQGKSSQSVFPLLSLFAIAALRIMPSAKRISSTLPLITYYKHSVDAIYHEIKMLEKTPIEQLIEVDQQDFSFQNTIELRDISYKYPNAKIEALQNICLTIEKGTSTAFVGSSGAGKTTIVDILLGLLTPNKGKVLIDERDIQPYLMSWQHQIGYIPQKIYLSDESIRQNVAFGLPESDINNDQVWAALEAAQLDEFIKGLPDKLDTMVGELGVRLSGGQQQRIGIARALYHNPNVLVMDEATAALDNTTEQEFIKALDHLTGEKTLVIIAHRLTTIKKCDHIYLLESGQVTATGTYSELLKSSKIFREMAQVLID
ncbi:MAG: ABC transporter ATP-binding protein [Acaryochloris sp. RU_4_1]|nr:ABC transporter ATP-binding protein [Acaryochloris sp. RU_4_1]NJR53983.1 ABC transporter ATP-binding protein [Acaryochloris sp. CRU_2_0]